MNNQHILKKLNQAQNFYTKIKNPSNKFIAYKQWMEQNILKPKNCALLRTFYKSPALIDKQFVKQYQNLDLYQKVNYYSYSLIYAVFQQQKNNRLYEDINFIKREQDIKQNQFGQIQNINNNNNINHNNQCYKIKALISCNNKPKQSTIIHIRRQYLISDDRSDIDLKYYFCKKQLKRNKSASTVHKYVLTSIRENVYPKKIQIELVQNQNHLVEKLDKAIVMGHKQLIKKMIKKQENSENSQKNITSFIKRKTNIELQKLSLIGQNFLQDNQLDNTRQNLIRKQQVCLFPDEGFHTITQTQSKGQQKQNQISFDYCKQEDITAFKQSSIAESTYLNQYFQLNPEKNYSSYKKQENSYGNFMLKNDWTQQNSGDIYLSNKEALKEQDVVVKYMMKKITDNLFGGKNLTTISLPVNIFKPQSHTQSMAKSFCLGPHFLQKAFQSHNALQRIKYALCFAHSHLVLYFEPEKPFNPILGQTYQGFIKGCPIYCEQISHHPPVTSFYMVGRGYKVYGSIEQKMSTGFNCIIGHHFGLYTVQFDDGQKINFTSPKVKLSGVVFGKRKFFNLGQQFIFDYENSLFGQISYEDENSYFSSQKWKYSDQFSGEIYETSRSFINQFIQSKYSKRIANKQKIINHCNIQGRVAHFLNINSKTYYNINEILPYILQQQKNPLKSHSNFRSDIKYKKLKQIQISQKQKQILEQSQRHDAKLRKKYRNH